MTDVTASFATVITPVALTTIHCYGFLHGARHYCCSFSIAALSASNFTFSFFAMNFPFIMTEGQGGGSFSMAYSLDVLLITLICAPNSLSA
jgi:hypothetical protein